MELYHKRIVVKVGSSTLTKKCGQPDLQSFNRIVCVLADLQSRGYQIILVSSGSVAAGTDRLLLKEMPAFLPLKQASAAVGQCSIIRLYDKLFSRHGKTIAQILICPDDLAQEIKAKNLTLTFNTLLKMGVIPIVNENDPLSCSKIKSKKTLFSDNDMLSAIVAVMCRAKRLIILSDVDGLYDSDPHLHPEANRIERVNQIDEEVYALAGGTGTRRGRGGMHTKLQAAALATNNGIDTILVSGSCPQALYEIVKGNAAGTVFVGRHSV